LLGCKGFEEQLGPKKPHRADPLTRAPLAIALMVAIAALMVASLARLEDASGLMAQAKEALENVAAALGR
jgi:hypothetical protein